MLHPRDIFQFSDISHASSSKQPSLVAVVDITPFPVFTYMQEDMVRLACGSLVCAPSLTRCTRDDSIDRRTLSVTTPLRTSQQQTSHVFSFTVYTKLYTR